MSGNVTILAGSATASVLNVTIPGSTLGTNNAVRTTADIEYERFAVGVSVLTTVTYGGGIVASVSGVTTAAYGGSIAGTIEHTLFARGNVALQRSTLKISYVNPVGSLISAVNYNSALTSVASGGNQSLVISMQRTDTGGTTGGIALGGYIVEKID